MIYPPAMGEEAFPRWMAGSSPEPAAAPLLDCRSWIRRTSSVRRSPLVAIAGAFSGGRAVLDSTSKRWWPTSSLLQTRYEYGCSPVQAPPPSPAGLAVPCTRINAILIAAV